MIYNRKQLFVNIPIDGYCFNLPNEIYDSDETADINRCEGEATMSVENAMDRIFADIHHDA